MPEEPASFEGMGLREDLLKGVYSYGFLEPSVAQRRTIPPMLQGKDVILQSQSGTGKTGAFGIPALQLTDVALHHPQVLILSNTRELAEQTQRVLQSLAAFSQIVVHCCVGGKSMEEDKRVLQLGAHVVSGTPGRVFDMIQRKVFVTAHVRLLVVDEADNMLSGEFKNQLYELHRYLPPLQVVLASATLPPPVLALAAAFMKQPVRILLRRDELALEGIRQFFVDVGEEQWKLETLCDIYERATIAQAVVFVNTRPRLEQLLDSLVEKGFTVCMIHGGLPQKEREQTMADFRAGNFRVLLATDIWARGLDVQQVSLVVNYDLPSSRENYLHRIGRSGRYGRKGVAISFVVSEDIPRLKDIQRFYSTAIEELPDNFGEFM